MVKEGINGMETTPNVVEKAITHRKETSKKDKSISNESKKGMSLDKSSSLDKSRSSQRTET